MQGKTAHIYDGPMAAKEITPDKRAKDSVNEKWPEMYPGSELRASRG